MHLVLLIYQAMSQHTNILCFNSEKHTSLSQVIVKLTRMRLLNLKQDDPLLPFLAINSRMLQNLEGLFIAICLRGELYPQARAVSGIMQATPNKVWPKTTVNYSC